jgi:glycosyltransferase involved in cell wall biosynthesis
MSKAQSGEKQRDYGVRNGQAPLGWSESGADLRIPLVSILMPAYNAEKWIEESLRSAIGQSWSHHEVIVVDDGSTDRTYEVACQFESPSVRVVRQENQGAAAARNKVYSLCRGEYIQWLDADDLLEVDKISLQMEAVRQGVGKEMLLSCEWGRFMYRKERAVYTPTALWQDQSPLEWLLRKMGQNLYMSPANWLVSRELCEAAGPWDTRMLGDDDGEYFCRVLLASKGVHFVSQARSLYRKTSTESLSKIGRSEKRLKAHWHSMQLHIGYLRSMEESARVRDACIRYLQTWLVTFYMHQSEIVKEMEQMAVELGGKLNPPTLTWKYACIQKVFGWKATMETKLVLSRWRTSLAMFLDRCR